MGGGCCWYRKFELNGGGLGIGVIELWLGKPGLPRPREPKMGECWPAIEKKGLGWGGGSCSMEDAEDDLSGSLGGIGQGSTKDLSFSSTPADFNLSLSSSLISGNFSKSSRSVRILFTSCFRGTYSESSFRALSWKERSMKGEECLRGDTRSEG